MLTTRQRLMALLACNPASPTDLAASLGLPLKDILHHLGHVQKSVRPPKRFLVEPAECLDCGFVFKDRRKLNAPGRCPKCKSTRLQEPRFRVS
ncbi:MAG: transcriptional regulator [Deltaproteobacteria bacterium]|nr:transcriptional regulator [Deltaproteobacteria bacterium]